MNKDVFSKDIYFRYINTQLLGDINIMDVGFECCSASKPIIYIGARENVAIHFVYDGVGYVETGDKKYKLTKNCMFFSPVKSTYYPDAKNPWKYMWIELNGGKAMTVLAKMGFVQDEPVYQCQNSDVVENIFRSCISNNNLCISTDDAFCLSKLFELVATIAVERNIVGRSNQSKNKQCVEFVLAFIEKNFNNREICTLSSIAKQLYFSPIYLNRIFKKETGYTVYQYIIVYRISAACSLLSNRNMSIAEVARCVGFDDPAHFTKIFRQHMNVPPTLYNKREEN